MPNPWIDSVKQTHQLTYYLSGVTGQWLTAVQEAVREFNAVSAQRNLGVTYVQTDQAPTDTGGATSASPPPTVRSRSTTRAAIRRR